MQSIAVKNAVNCSQNCCQKSSVHPLFIKNLNLNYYQLNKNPPKWPESALTKNILEVQIMTNTNITYTQQGDYLLPDLKLPEQKN